MTPDEQAATDRANCCARPDLELMEVHGRARVYECRTCGTQSGQVVRREE